MATTLKWPSYVTRPQTIVSATQGRDYCNGGDCNNVRQPSFMREYEPNRAHVADNPEAFEDSIRTILVALA